MTLQSSGAIKFSELRGEFGGSVPDAISEYYRGGGLVPDTPGNSSIPTSGAISPSDFYGTSSEEDRADEICLITHNITGTGVGGKSPVPGAAGILFQPNGDLLVTIEDTGSPSPAVNTNEWHCDNPGSGLGNDWEIRATLTSGTTPTFNAGLGTWLRLNANKSWSNTRIASSGTTTSTLTFEFRLFGGAIIQKTITGIVLKAIFP